MRRNTIKRSNGKIVLMSMLVMLVLFSCLVFYKDDVFASKKDETFKFGDYVYFGHYGLPGIVVVNDEVETVLKGKASGFYEVEETLYYVDAQGKPRNCIPMRWMVIADEGDKLLLLQDYVVTGAAWDSDEDGNSITWANSDIRAYINSDSYLGMFFSEKEKADIRNSIVTNTATGDSTSFVGETVDKLYLPSMSELKTWFPEDEDKRVHYFANDIATPSITTPISGFGNLYAYDENDYTCAYWTRTPENLNYGMLRPAMVGSDGWAGRYNRVYNTWSMGIRPLMRISKDSVNYYRAPKNVNLDFTTENDMLVTYPTDSFQVPVVVTGDNMVEQFKPYIMGTAERHGISSSTRSRITDASLLADVYAGMYTIKCYLYGVNPEPIVVEIPLKVEFGVETVQVKTNKANDGLDLMWYTDRPSWGYEISRSTSKDGTYEVIYRGKIDYSGNDVVRYDDKACYYTDSKVVSGQEYWYKVKGLILINDAEYSDSYLGIVSQYSEAVSGKLTSTTVEKPKEPEINKKPENNTSSLDGLRLVNGEWLYYKNGQIDKTKYGFVNYGGSKFLVAHGRVAKEKKGLAQDPNNTSDWYFLSRGQAQLQYTGLAQYDGAWFYVNKGLLDTKMAGYVNYDTGLFYVGAGRIMTEVNGLAQDLATKKWYYLANGQVQLQHTGLVQYDGAWFYVIEGALAEDFTGNVEYDGSTFYVVNGQLKL